MPTKKATMRKAATKKPAKKRLATKQVAAHKSAGAKLATRTITQSVTIRATPVEVYDALVNAKKHAEFTGVPATSANKIGGKFTAWDGYISGKYLKLEPGRKILEEWSTRDWPANFPPSVIELTFAKADGGMRLSMLQTEVPAAQAANYRKGWKDYYWNPLKKYFAAKAKI